MTDKKRGLEIEDLSVEDLRDAKGKSVHPLTYDKNDSDGIKSPFVGATKPSTTIIGNIDDSALFASEGDALKAAGFKEPLEFKL